MFHSIYIAPHTLDELLTCLHQYGSEAKIIAGGTDLIPQMRLGKQNPQVLLDPIRLPLSRICEVNREIFIRARFTHSQALYSSLLKAEYSALVDACLSVGGPPVRNRGTLAGNLANASPAADSALPLLVYDAQVLALRQGGERLIPLSEFYRGPGHTCLAADEFIREIRLPRLPSQTVSIFLKLGNRQAMAIAVASVAVRLSLSENGLVGQARIALGSVAPMPVRAYQAEAILQSSLLDQDTIHNAAQSACEAAAPISDLRASSEYRRKMVFVLTHRALQMASQQLAKVATHAQD